MPKAKKAEFTPGGTVAEEWEARNRCRTGLGGLRMRHVPTGREFVCGGSRWHGPARVEDKHILIYPARNPRIVEAEVILNMARRLGEGTPEFRRELESHCGPDVWPAAKPYLTTTCAADFARGWESEGFRPEDCVLLEPWPVVCCKPRRRRTAKAR